MELSKTNQDRTIQKFWISKERGTDSIILVSNNIIYKGNKSPGQIDESISQIYSGKIPNDLFSLPYNYINKIQLQEGKKYILITFSKDSTEQFRVEDDNTRNEIFEYFKNNIEGAQYEYVEYSWIKTIRKPLIALVVLSILCIWAYFVADMIETRQNVGTQLVIIIFLAGLGTNNLVLLYSAIFAICAVSIALKLKNPPKIHELKLK